MVKFCLIIFLFVHIILSQDIPYFVSFPSSPISNFNQSSVLIQLRCTTPLYLFNNNNSLVSISDISIQQFNQWFSLNNPIVLSTDSNDFILPQIISFTSYDISLSFPTSNSKVFTLLIFENNFYNGNKISIPYSSPLIITTTDNNYHSPDVLENSLKINQYSKKYIKSWEDKNIDVILKNAISVRYTDGLPFLDIILSIPESGKGTIKINPKINIDGNEYNLDEIVISVSKKDPIFKLPIQMVDTLTVVQEETSKFSLSTPPLYKSSRLEFFADVLKVKSGILLYVEQPTMFNSFTISDIAQLENNEISVFNFRFSDSTNNIAVEYIWNNQYGWQKRYPYLYKGYSCKFLDARNQFCPYCPEVYHRMADTNYTYIVYQTNGVIDLVDYGLDFFVNVFDSSFYFKNQNEKVLQNSQSSLGFSFQNSLNLGTKFILSPENKIEDSSYYLWMQNITNGCGGINITYSDFYYQSSCQTQQYTCSNIHFFRDPQDETLLINNHNYNFGNKRAGIMYNGESLSFEILQQKLDLNLSLYIPSLPFLQPFIKQHSFKATINNTYIYITYSFLNHGKSNGEFNINIICNGTNNGLDKSGSIKPNEILEFSFSIPKSIIFKKTRTYECISSVSVNTKDFWSKTDKQIQSTEYFSFNDNDGNGTGCNQIFKKDSIIISRQFFNQPIKEEIAFIFKIENQIESIDWFLFNVSCLNDNTQSKTIQIPYNYFLIVPVTIKLNSSPKCRVSIESYDQFSCRYNLYSNDWNYIQDIGVSNSLKSISLIKVLVIIATLLLLK